MRYLPCLLKSREKDSNRIVFRDLLERANLEYAID
jgi:hypothetical protein